MLNRIFEPSGDQSGYIRDSPEAGLTFLGVPPLAGMRQILPVNGVFGICLTKAISCPSGDQVGKLLVYVNSLVSCVGSLALMGTTQISERVSPCTALEKATFRPLGETDGS